MTVPHDVWRAIESIPRPRGPYDACTCGSCQDERAHEANTEAVRTARGEE